MNLQLIEAGKARVLDRAYRRVDGRERELLAALPDAVAELLKLPRKAAPVTTAAAAPVASHANALGLTAWAVPFGPVVAGGLHYERAVAPGVSFSGMATALKNFRPECTQATDAACGYGAAAAAGAAWYFGGVALGGWHAGGRAFTILERTARSDGGSSAATPQTELMFGAEGRAGYRWVDTSGFTFDATLGLIALFGGVTLDGVPCTGQSCPQGGPEDNVVLAPFAAVTAGMSF